MGNFVDIAGSILAQSERRLEVSAQNIANMTTPGYKRRTSFETLVGSDASATATDRSELGSVDFSVGKQINTNNPYDLAIQGGGFFAVRSDSGVVYTRRGQFQRDSSGKIETAEGYALQMQGGGDLVTKGAAFQVLGDGAVTENSEPLGKLEIVDFTDRQAVARNDAGMFSAADANVFRIETASIRQGALEASNVSTADEMVSMMGALRSAESGQRLVNIYDDLMGRALSVFGQA